MLEGMPGAGKTTAASALAGEGHHVVGEYITRLGDTLPIADHPPADDDQAHLGNWLTKQHHVAAAQCRQPVLCDRDWISALAYAASLDDNGHTLETRIRWVWRELLGGGLAVADIYVVVSADPASSLERRADRLASGHPWSDPSGLERLTAFYADPIRAVGPVLGGLLQHATWRHLDSPDIDDLAAHLRELLGEPPRP